MIVQLTTTIRQTVEPIETATHYSGDLRDNPTWWRYRVNSTGVIRTWQSYRKPRMESGPADWYIDAQDSKPEYVHKIPAAKDYEELP